MVCRRPLSLSDRPDPLEDFEQIGIPNVERGWSNEGGPVDSVSARAMGDAGVTTSAVNAPSDEDYSLTFARQI
jgi:hypothetical protein